jgi:hypothetical protein
MKLAAAAAVTPACRLRLEGGETLESACDILQLSPGGVTIAINDGRVARRGQNGHLLIGPAEGDHYTLPVAVRRVKPFWSASFLELGFPPTEPWSCKRG